MTSTSSVTLSYVPAEDRLLIAMQVRDRAVCLWLTQRLSRSLVAALTAHVEKTERVATGGDRPRTLRSVTAVSAIRQGRPALASNAPAHLVHQVSLKLAAERLALCFATDLDFRSNLVLDRKALRQWLSALHRQFVLANWPLDVWPKWIANGGSVKARAVTVH